MVQAADMAKFYSTVCATDNAITRDYILFLLFTGMRSSEARSLRWKNVDFHNRVIRVTETKNKKMLDLPMSDFVRSLLVARRQVGDADYVFPGPRGQMAAPRREAITSATGVDVSNHDLRRTFITVAARTPGVNPFQLKALVNHSIGGADVTSGYICLTVEDLREPAQRIADRIKELCGVEDDRTVARIG
jgi:integrase